MSEKRSGGSEHRWYIDEHRGDLGWIEIEGPMSKTKARERLNHLFVAAPIIDYRMQNDAGDIETSTPRMRGMSI